jgi:glycosyltransferase involved in cell wall biosynthesis
MKILYFTQHFSTPRGSVGIRAYQMARNLIARGHQVTVVCGSYRGATTGLQVEFVSGKRRGVVDGIEIVELDLAYENADGFVKRAAIFMWFALRSIGIAMREPCDVVFATTTPLTAGIPGIFARWIRRKPFVFEVRDLWPDLPKAMGAIRNPLVLWAMSALEWVSYRSATRLIGLSPGIVDGIARCGIPKSRIAMISNGCDMAIFSNVKSPWRPPGVSERDLLALFAGTHGLANGLDAILDVAVVLKRRARDDIKLVLIGEGRLKSRLESEASSKGLDNIVFHEPVSKERLSALMASTDLGMQILANVPAFYYGTSPNKFFDYIAAGLPVLINYPGWLAELVERRGFGFAVPADDPEAFANALMCAADDRASLRAMGAISREVATSVFNRPKLADEWVAWVVGAVDRHGK